MNPRQAFLAAICDAPQDDLRRLVFADWLEESPDEADHAQAEFIRVMIEAERFNKYTPERLTLEEQATAILERHRNVWLAGVPDWAADADDPPGLDKFSRGFLNTIWVQSDRFALAHQDLFAAAPVQKATLSVIRDGGKVLAACAGLARLSQANLHFTESRADLPTLLNSDYLATLRELSLKFYGPPFPGAEFHVCQPMLGDEDAVAVADCRRFKNLKKLDVSSGTIGPDGAAALARSRHLTSLECLDIGGNPIGDDGLILLADSPLCKRLVELDICGTRVGNTGFRALFDARPTRLQRLGIGGDSFGVDKEGLKSLARCESITHFQELDVSEWSLTGPQMRVLAQSPVLSGLRVLFAGGTNFSSASAIELARSPYMRNLRYLDLQRNRIGPRGLKALARSPVFGTVTNIELYNCPIGDEGVIALASSEHVGELRRLSLCSTGLTAAGARAIAQSPHFTQLRHLDVQSNAIGDVGGSALCESPYLQKITNLSVYTCRIGRDVERALRKRFGTALRIETSTGE